MMIVTLLLSFITVLFIYNYHVHHRRNGRLIDLIPGPPFYPIIGSWLKYLRCYDSREAIWKMVTTISNDYYPILKFWSFFRPLIFIRHPDDLQTILRSTKHDKGLIYDAFRILFRNGLVTSEGAEWHSQRKLLNPAFNLNILKEFVKVFIEEGKSMTMCLKNEGDLVIKNLMPFFSEHTLNALCETVRGVSLRDFGEFTQLYVEAGERMNELFLHRIIWILWNIIWIFPLTSKGREQRKVLKILRGFTERVIAERKLYHEQTNGRYLQSLDNDTSTVSDDTSAEPRDTRRKRLALLDLLIKASRDGFMSDLDIIEQVDVFMAAGHHTTATSLCFTFALLAEHKDIQDRVRNEINSALEKNGEEFTMELLQDLPYLERCIKESMRIYPTVYLISRTTKEDVKLQSYLVPAGTVMILDIYGVHRDPNFWENPEVFDPDRFLPEKIQNRHRYSYIPFSAGPRNCIGERFAMLEMKAMIAPLVHNFYLEPVNDLKTLRIEPGLVLRPAVPLHVKFIRIR